MSDDPYHLSGLPFKRVSLASTLAGPYQQLARQSHSSRRLRRRFSTFLVLALVARLTLSSD